MGSLFYMVISSLILPAVAAESAATSIYMWLAGIFGVLSLALIVLELILLVLVKKYRPLYQAEIQIRRQDDTYMAPSASPVGSPDNGGLDSVSVMQDGQSG